jgi:hypothetical protein
VFEHLYADIERGSLNAEIERWKRNFSDKIKPMKVNQLDDSTTDFIDID